MSDFLKVFGPITLLVAAGFWVAYQFVDPAPPAQPHPGDRAARRGAYHAFGQRYKALLAEDGIDVRLLNTAGSVENMAHLSRTEEGDDAPARVDIAFVQSGIGSPAETPGLVSLGQSLLRAPVGLCPGAITPAAPDRTCRQASGGRCARQRDPRCRAAASRRERPRRWPTTGNGPSAVRRQGGCRSASRRRGGTPLSS